MNYSGDYHMELFCIGREYSTSVSQPVRCCRK